MTVPSVFHCQLASVADAFGDRSEAEAIARRLRPRLQAGDTVLLDFAAVQVATLPFVDELLGQLQRHVTAYPQSMLVVHGMNAVVRAYVKRSLQTHEMVLAVLSPRGISLMGAGDDLRKLMRAAQRLDSEFSPAELAEVMARRPERVQAEVETLMHAGALGGRRGRRLRLPPRDRLLALTS
jgi:hypothetical protein